MKVEEFQIIQEVREMRDFQGFPVKKVEDALQSAAQLLVDILKGECNPEEESERWLEEFAPEFWWPQNPKS